MIPKIIEIIYYLILLFLAIKSILLIVKYGFIARNFLSIYIVFTAALELYSYVKLLIDENSSTGMIYNFYCIFSIFLFYIYFIKIFQKVQKFIFQFIFASIIIYYFLLTKFYLSQFDISIGILISLYYISISLLWFYQKIITFDESKITDDPVFWVSTALLLWSCFFIFRVTPMFFLDAHDKAFLEFLRTTQNIVNILMYLMFYISLIKYERKLG